MVSPFEPRSGRDGVERASEVRHGRFPYTPCIKRHFSLFVKQDGLVYRHICPKPSPVPEKVGKLSILGRLERRFIDATVPKLPSWLRSHGISPS